MELKTVSSTKNFELEAKFEFKKMWAQKHFEHTKILSSEKNIVFMLWGNFAQLKEKFIDLNSNLVLKTSHPSPLSAYRGFTGSRPFSKSNKFLKSKGKKVIDWSL